MTVSSEFLNGPAVTQVPFTRLYNAPSSLVFEAWTDPGLLQRWFVPRGSTVVFDAFDFRAGGAFRAGMRGRHGNECRCHGVFLEIVVPEWIVLTAAITDANNHTLMAEATIAVTFTARTGGRSKLTLHHIPGCAYTGTDWPEVLDRLSGELAKAWRIGA